MSRKFSTEYGNENDIIDAENDFQRNQRDQSDPTLRIRYPFQCSKLLFIVMMCSV